MDRRNFLKAAALSCAFPKISSAQSPVEMTERSHVTLDSLMVDSCNTNPVDGAYSAEHRFSLIYTFYGPDLRPEDRLKIDEAAAAALHTDVRKVTALLPASDLKRKAIELISEKLMDSRPISLSTFFKRHTEELTLEDFRKIAPHSMMTPTSDRWMAQYEEVGFEHIYFTALTHELRKRFTAGSALDLISVEVGNSYYNSYPGCALG